MSHTYRHHHAWRVPQSWPLPPRSCPRGRRRCPLCSRAKVVRFKQSRTGQDEERRAPELDAQGA